MVRVPQQRGRKPAKKYVSDLTPTNLERQGYFGTDRRKPGSVPTPAASVMYDYYRELFTTSTYQIWL